MSSARADSGRPVASPASGGVSSTVETEYHHTVASTRGSPVPCHRARTASASAVHAGSARRTAGTTSAPGGSTRPSAAAPGTRAATAACTRSATGPVCRGDYCSPAGAPVMLTIHAMPYLSVHMPKLSPHGAFSSGMVTLPPCTSPSQ